MSEDINLQTKTDTEVNQLIINQWGFLDQNKYNHRAENKDIYDIKNIKDELKNKLGFTTVFSFYRLYIPIKNIQVLKKKLIKD